MGDNDLQLDTVIHELRKAEADAALSKQHVEDIAVKVGELEAEVARLRAREAKEREITDLILAGDCPPDGKHCTCVPLLRAEVARLRTHNESLAAKLSVSMSRGHLTLTQEDRAVLTCPYPQDVDAVRERVKELEAEVARLRALCREYRDAQDALPQSYVWATWQTPERARYSKAMSAIRDAGKETSDASR